MGDLFEYKLKEPITIRKNQSALVPIVQADVGVEKVSVWNDMQGLPRPMRALWLTNSTKMTLDGGSFSVLDSEAFAGEGMLQALQAGERRLVSYAADLALVPDTPTFEESTLALRARAAKGVLVLEREATYKKTYRFRNNDKEAREVIVEHPRRQDRKLRNTNAEETTPGFYRFRVKVPAGQTAALEVWEAREYPQEYAISSLDGDGLAMVTVEGKLTAERQELLRQVMAKKAAVSALSSSEEQLEKEQQGIYDDQERLRENVKALKGSAEEKALIQRYVGQLNEHENRLGQLKKEREALAKRIEAAEAELEKAVQAVVF